MRLCGSLTGYFLLLGLALRVWHFLRVPSVWHDEAALLVNVLGKNFAELLGPLTYAEAAPPLFLWIEHAVALVLGDGVTGLRLVPFLASCASLLLVTWTARQALAPAAAPWAVLLFAASDRLLWHGCEAKPYAVDMLVSVLVIALFQRLRGWPVNRQLLLYAALAPALIFLSYPACFVFGGLLVVLLGSVAGERRIITWACYGLLIAAVFGAFALLVHGPVHAQRHPAMDQCWVHQFPPWEQPWRIPTWVLFSTFDVFRYCFEPAGPALAFLAVVGAILHWRRGERSFVVLALLPLVLALAASFRGSYPYGGARVEVFAAPGLALFVGAGVPPVWQWLENRLRFSGLALAAVLLVAPFLAIYHAVVPWRRPDCAGAAAYVLEHRRPDEIVAENLWPYDYYFRRLGPALLPMEDSKRLPRDRRLWIVMTAWPTPVREEMLADAAGRRKILDRREFTDTTVVLLERVSPSGN